MKLNFEKIKEDLQLDKRKTVKDNIASVKTKDGGYIIRWKDKSKSNGEIDKGGTTTLHFEDHDNMIKILLQLSKKYKNKLISAESIARELTKIHPDLKSDMLRPTSKYMKFYYMSLHLQHHMKNIIYFYNGEIFLDKGFYYQYGDGIPERPKRGLEKWMSNTKN